MCSRSPGPALRLLRTPLAEPGGDYLAGELLELCRHEPELHISSLHIAASILRACEGRVAQYRGALVGAVFLYPRSAGWLEIGTLIVHRRYRTHGLGQLLLASLVVGRTRLLATARSHRSAPPAAAQPPRAVPRAASRRRERSVAARPAPPAVAVAAVAALRLAVALRDPLALRSFLLVFVVRGLVRFTFSHEGAGSQADKWCGGSNLNRRIPSEPGPKPGAIGHAMRPPRHRVTAQRIY